MRMADGANGAGFKAGTALAVVARMLVRFCVNRTGVFRLHSNRVTIAVAMALPHKRACKKPVAECAVPMAGRCCTLPPPAPTRGAIRAGFSEADDPDDIPAPYPDRRPWHILIQRQSSGAREFQAGNQRADTAMDSGKRIRDRRWLTSAGRPLADCRQAARRAVGAYERSRRSPARVGRSGAIGIACSVHAAQPGKHAAAR